ncbi:proteasome assembly chaperone 2 [Spinellus fusiger]|nr:proteasome assembly chaperone 2 [Spinellus fusiger]
MDLFVGTPSYEKKYLHGSVLIMPTVSIGNVPQLTCDLLLHTLSLERVGFINDSSVVPVAGAREGKDYGVSVPIEVVFQSSDHQWTVVQQRSPTEKGKKRQYLDNMQAFVKKYQFKQVILLTSADASCRVDAQINSIPFRVIGTGNESLVEKTLAIGVPLLEQKDTTETDAFELSGSGLARPLFRRLKEINIPTTLLSMFALEGDNVSDSIAFANLINTLLNIKNSFSAWTPPKSWEYLFGTPYNAELYQ